MYCVENKNDKDVFSNLESFDFYPENDALITV